VLAGTFLLAPAAAAQAFGTDYNGAGFSLAARSPTFCEGLTLARSKWVEGELGPASQKTRTHNQAVASMGISIIAAGNRDNATVVVTSPGDFAKALVFDANVRERAVTECLRAHGTTTMNEAMKVKVPLSRVSARLNQAHKLGVSFDNVLKVSWWAGSRTATETAEVFGPKVQTQRTAQTWQIGAYDISLKDFAVSASPTSSGLTFAIGFNTAPKGAFKIAVQGNNSGRTCTGVQDAGNPFPPPVDSWGAARVRSLTVSVPMRTAIQTGPQFDRLSVQPQPDIPGNGYAVTPTVQIDADAMPKLPSATSDQRRAEMCSYGPTYLLLCKNECTPLNAALATTTQASRQIAEAFKTVSGWHYNGTSAELTNAANEEIKVIASQYVRNGGKGYRIYSVGQDSAGGHIVIGPR
jgi:hypothetical protein